MNNSSEIVDIKKTYLAIATMLMAILCVDLYMVVIKFLEMNIQFFSSLFSEMSQE